MRFFLPALLLIFLPGCSEHRQPPVVASQQSNDPFETKEISSYGKRAPETILNQVYQEQLKNSPELRKLEEKLYWLRENIDDSTEVFGRFHNRNVSFFQDAASLASSISDSTLRTQMMAFVQRSKEHTTRAEAGLSNLNSAIAEGTRNVYALHQALKLAVTVPVVEQFATTSLPSASPLQHYLQQQRALSARLRDTIQARIK